MELSLLCDVKVFLFIFDKNADAKLLHYQSDGRDNYISTLFRDCCNPKNFYSNSHYQYICGKASEQGAACATASLNDSTEYINGTAGLLPFQQQLQNRAELSTQLHYTNAAAVMGDDGLSPYEQP